MIPAIYSIKYRHVRNHIRSIYHKRIQYDNNLSNLNTISHSRTNKILLIYIQFNKYTPQTRTDIQKTIAFMIDYGKYGEPIVR